MRTLYIECKMGVAGDMLTAALYELLDETKKEEFLRQINTLLGPDIRIYAERRMQTGIMGTHMHVTVRGKEEHGANAHQKEGEHHSHHSYASVIEQIKRLPLDATVRSHVSAVYQLIGEAEADVHGMPIEQIHFHEVGSLDALADVTSVCLLISLLKPEQIIVSPIHVGNGMVHCAHGILPVPAPATAALLKGIPFYTGSIDTELCTPTGAALIKHFAADFGNMPPMKPEYTGIGLGSKELPLLNAVRVFLGDTEECMARQDSDKVLDISCNLDDMTGEALGYTMEVLLEAGALDVFYVPIQMKKNRPGILLHCLCEPSGQDTFVALMLRHTTTRGVRFQLLDRRKMISRFEETSSAYGPITRKISEGNGIAKAKYEFEDIKRIAKEQGISLSELYERL